MDRNATWIFLAAQLAAGQPVALLYVLDSEGSSPGRRGFHMVAAGDGGICGSIGGGIMEHKLVEKARKMLAERRTSYWLRKQVHRKEETSHRSGMICSGEQLVLIWPIYERTAALKSLLEALQAGQSGLLRLSPQGLAFGPQEATGTKELVYHSEEDWNYSEVIGEQPWVHIIGGGHVGLALSRQMAMLDYQVGVYDDRPGLNTMEQNQFAQRKKVIEYGQVGEQLDFGPADCIIIMTFGYRSDKLVLQQLLGRAVFFLGMMGSEAKIKQLLAELVAEGVEEEALAEVHAPIGLSIYSKTPAEIAVSIAGQIISKRNEKLPTGRNG